MDSFTWRDGERTIRFGRGTIAGAPDLIGTDGHVLLTTDRARAMAPELAAGATEIHHVRPGRVDEIAGELLGTVSTDLLLVALGGGRVVDTAKAIASARADGTRVAAIPTTLSAAEMTAVHRRADGSDPELPGVRPAVVINDPALSASQPEGELAASAANALAHAAEGPATTHASPVPALAGEEAARLIAQAFATTEPDRDALALAALLSGYAIDSAWYGLHHVCSQTLVRVAGIAHGAANAAMLPHTLRALAERGRGRAGDHVALAEDLARRARATSLDALGVTATQLDAAADAAAGRPELDLTPPRATRDELRALYAAAA